MSPTTRPCNCRFRSSSLVALHRFRAKPHARRPAPQTKAGSHGYALLLVMMTVTLLLVALTAALPSVYMEAQREREEELIFRGNEYSRAIALYHTRFNRYPATVDDLLKKTNGFRALRHAYKDPMTKSGKWRFIHVNAAGILVDSKTMNMQGGAGALGSNSPFGGTAGSTGLGQGGAFGFNAGGTGQGTSFGFGSSGTAGQTGGAGQTGPATLGKMSSGQNGSGGSSTGNGDS
jgi:type II secretory pathway pseudopilin PulG